ncbi:MAG: glycine zipper 2TM domain-containing protein [Rhodospirillales bacterium]|nr:glycine zipper 2TM domain-containing protein [Rhodospirillales bacterium]
MFWQNRSGFKPLAALMAAILALTACQAIPPDDPRLSPEERRLREQAADYNRTVAEGAIAGAVIGAILGAALAGRNNRGQGAIIGAAAGGALGAASGYYVAKQKEAFATEQARLDSMIGDVRADNARIEALIANAQSVIASNRAQLEDIQKRVNTGQMNRQTAKAEVERIEDNQRVITRTVENLRKKADEYREASMKTSQQGVNTGPMNAEIGVMQANIARLEAELAGLTEALNVSRLG